MKRMRINAFLLATTLGLSPIVNFISEYYRIKNLYKLGAIIIFLIFILVNRDEIKKKFSKYLKILIPFIVLFGYSFFSEPDINTNLNILSEYLKNQGFLLGILAIVLVYTKLSWKFFNKIFLIYSIVDIFCLGKLISSNTLYRSNPGSYMTFGFAVLFYLMFIFESLLTEEKIYRIKKIILFGFFNYGFFNLVLYANRSSLLVLIIFIIARISKTIKKFILYLILILSVFLLLKNNILGIIKIFSENKLIDSRNMIRFAQILEKQESFHQLSTGRDLIYIKSLELIERNPFFGRGISYLRIESSNKIAHAHFIFLDLLLHVGIIGFMIVILILMRKAYYYYLYYENDEAKKFILPLIFVQISLFFSKLYLVDYLFLIFILFPLKIHNLKKSRIKKLIR